MWIDIGFLLFAMYGLYLGFKKGIIRTIISLASILIGIVLALKLSPFVITFAKDLFKSDSIVVVVLGFLATYFAIIALIRLGGKAIEKLFKKVKLNFVNKTIGGVVLSIFFVFIYSILVWFLTEAAIISEDDKSDSLTYSILEALPAKGEKVFEDIKPFFQEFWELTKEATSTE
jgi:membrane protein required for colicin V production